MFRGLLSAAAVRLLAVLVVLTVPVGLSVAVSSVASAAGGTLYAYSAGGATAPASCPQSGTATQRCSLAQALALAHGGDSVLLAESGPYVGSFTIAAPDTATDGAVTLGPVPGVSRPVLDGANRNTVLNVADGVRADVAGITVQHGSAPDRDDAPCIEAQVTLGGGIYNHGVLALTDVVVRDNVAEDSTGHGLVGIGGGIYNAGRLTVTGSTFDNNTATGSGGAISDGDDRSGCGTATGPTSVTVTGTTFTNNSADFGGAISTGGAGGDGTLTVSRSTFAHNGRTTAQSQGSGTAGGAIAVARGGSALATITGSTFTGNTAVRGGAISDSEGGPGGRLVVSDSTFVNNLATTRADAIDQGDATTPGLVVSTTFVNDTIAGNGSLRLAASIVSRSNGGGPASSGCQSPVTDAGYNVSDDATCGFASANHSLSDSTIPTYLGGLGAHGGPTETVPISSAVADPANDLIPAGFAPFGTAVCSGGDQRGVQRGNPCDAGAVESPITGAGLFAYPTGTGGADGSCPRTSVVAQRCTLTTALALAEAGGTVQLAESGDPNDPSTWYVGTFVVNVPGTSAAQPVTIAPASGVSNPIVDGNNGSATGCPTTRCDRPIFAVAGAVYVDLRDFTIQNGNAGLRIFGTTSGGSAIAVDGATVSATGLHVTGNQGRTVSVSDSFGGSVTFVDSVVDQPAGPGAVAVMADNGVVAITRTSVHGRLSADELTMTDSTVDGSIGANTATITGSTVTGDSTGLTAGTATVVGSTFAGNPGGAFQVGRLTLAASIVTRSPGGAANCSLPVTDDAGYNVSDDASCGLTGPGSVQSSAAIAAYLGVLGDNGGPTPTMALLATPTTAGAGPDPAARAIPATYTAPGETAPHCTLRDQRGVQRTPYCEIGAFELGGTAPIITSTDHATFTAGVSDSFTITTTGSPAAAVAASGILPVGLALTDNGDGTATLSGRASGAGTYAVTITAGNRTLPDATQTFTLTVAPAAQTITVTSTPPSAPVAGDEYQIRATGGASGNPLTYSVDPASRPSACSVDSSGLVVFTGAGPCVIDIDQAGNADYASAARVTQSMAVGRLSQVITFTSVRPASPAVGGTFHVTATGGGSGNPVTFAIDPFSAAGACALGTGDVVSFTGVGQCIIDADQAGNSEYDDAPTAFLVINVAKGAQSITYTSNPGRARYLGTYPVTATGGDSGQPVTFAVDPSSDAGVCTLGAGNVVSFTGVGTCVIAADQAGNAGYDAAPTARQTITVGRARQQLIITSDSPTQRTVGGTYQATATGGASGEPVVWSVDPTSEAGACTVTPSGLVTFTGVGFCVIVVNQAGNDLYDEAPDLHIWIVIGPATQAITFTSTPPADLTVADSYQVSATGGGSGQPVTFTVDPASDAGTCSVDAAGLVTFGRIGRCIIDADQAGTANFDPAPTVRQVIMVSQAEQTITVTSTPPDHAVVGATYQVDATGGASGNPIVFSVDPASAAGVCTVTADGLVTFTGVGDCVLALDQAGTDDYLAGHATVTLQVEPASTPSSGPTSTPEPSASSSHRPLVQGERRDDGLPFTGAMALPLLTMGTALVAAGLVLLLAFRRSRPGHRH